MKKLLLSIVLLIVSIAGIWANNTIELTMVDNVVMAGSTNDVNANPASLEILFQPQFGTAARTNSGQIIYTPNPGFEKDVVDSYTYQVCANNDPTECRQVESRVVIGDGNDFFACDDVFTVARGSSGNRLTVLNNDRNVSTNSLNIILAPVNGSLGLDNGVVTYTPPSSFEGSDEFLYSINSSVSGETAQIKVTVVVGNTNDLIGVKDCTYALADGDNGVIDCNIGSNCNDNNPCTINDRFDSDCDCVGNFQDSDNDGICDAEDDSNGNCTVNGSCNDGDSCTTNDTYDANCNCTGTFQDSDNDGLCDGLDSTNGNCNLDGSCNDGDDCTTNDEYDVNCNCSGTYQDSDNDGICDAEDLTNGNCTINGNCSDGNSCTTNDRFDSNCNCIGTLLDSDNDGICDLEDNTNGNCTLNGDCNDGNVCTVNDRFDANCDCTGTLLDSDNDGICDSNDNTDGDCSLNGICNDGNECTTNDRFDANCNCIGIFIDTDEDGICDVNDSTDGDCSFNASCNDGDDCTINDRYNSSCECEGVFQDSDGDGICNSEDDTNGTCTIGGNCTDGDDCTVNDQFDENCNCVGQFQDSDSDGICDANDPTDGNCNVGGSCSDGDVCTINDQFDSNCHCVGVFQDSDGDGICDANDQTDGNCNIGGSCNDGDACTINDTFNSNCNCEGEFQDSDGDGICDVNEIDPSCNIGGSCNDGDECTENDVFNSNCDCVGVFQDSDGDGVCDANDESDGNCNIGGSCNDGDECTENDVFNSNCNCVGEIQDSDNDGICDANEVDPACNVGGSCNDGDECTIDDTFDANCNCIGNYKDSDSDGICDANDQTDGNCNIGGSCNDGDECTINDAFDSECNCVGQFLDTDLDGICDAQDDEDNCDPGGFCDDGDVCTLIDRYDADCNCAGIFFDADRDGICNVLDETNGDCFLNDPCDDGDDCTINDSFDANCICRGEFQDEDEDGICDTEDTGEPVDPPVVDGNCTIDFETLPANTCENKDGMILIKSPNPGVGHFYEVIDENGEVIRINYTNGALVDFSNLEPGSYQLVISEGCEGSVIFTIADNGAFSGNTTSDSYTLSCGSFSLAMDVLANDSGIDESSLEFGRISPASAGKLVVEGNQIVFNVENGFVGTADFEYTICDENGCCTEVPGSIEVEFCTELLGPCIGNVLLDGDECGDEMGDIIIYNGDPGVIFFHTIFKEDGEIYAKNSTDDVPAIFKNVPTGTYTIQVERLFEPFCIETKTVTVVDCTESGDPEIANRCCTNPTFTVNNIINICDQNVSLTLLEQEAYESYSWLRDDEAILGAKGVECDVKVSGSYSVVVINKDGDLLESHKQYIEVCPKLKGGTSDMAFSDGEPVAIAVIDNDEMKYQIDFIKAPQNGSVSVIGNKIIYNPNPGFSGLDELYYTQVQENPCDCQLPLTKVMINVEQAENPREVLSSEATIETVDFDEDIFDTEQASFDVRVESSGSDFCPLNLIITQTPKSGVATISNDRKINYIPETGFTGEVVIGYMLCACSVCETGEIRINVKQGELEFFVPEAISPNGDGINDYFYIQNTDFATRFDNLTVRIFDASGNIVLREDNWDEMMSWDGKAYNTDVPEGVYYYILHFKGENNSLHKSGYFELRR